MRTEQIEPYSEVHIKMRRGRMKHPIRIVIPSCDGPDLYPCPNVEYALSLMTRYMNNGVGRGVSVWKRSYAGRWVCIAGGDE